MYDILSYAKRGGALAAVEAKKHQVGCRKKSIDRFSVAQQNLIPVHSKT